MGMKLFEAQGSSTKALREAQVAAQELLIQVGNAHAPKGTEENKLLLHIPETLEQLQETVDSARAIKYASLESIDRVQKVKERIDEFKARIYELKESFSCN